MATTDPDCIFCKIVSGDIPAEVVARTDAAIAFVDINPVAPTHVQVIPIAHQPNLAASVAADPSIAGGMIALAAEVAASRGLEGNYRLVANTGPDAGQEVFHTHLHLLGGRGFTWPPG